ALGRDAQATESALLRQALILPRRVIMACLCGLVLAGCASSKTPSASKTPAPGATATAATTQPIDASPSARLTVNEPCANRLHDICGPLLLYLTTNYRLPETLDELRQVPGSDGIGEFACPVSKQPYVYNPAGIVGPNVSQRAVIYDAAPTHGGYRKAIVIKEATPNAPFVAEVVAWPESRFPKTAPARE
ncbi:MAG: hypothetical protein WBD40_10345, partial [Tepidisphaeraceae bacterium]